MSDKPEFKKGWMSYPALPPFSLWCKISHSFARTMGEKFNHLATICWAKAIPGWQERCKILSLPSYKRDTLLSIVWSSGGSLTRNSTTKDYTPEQGARIVHEWLLWLSKWTSDDGVCLREKVWNDMSLYSLNSSLSWKFDSTVTKFVQALLSSDGL